jgi:putative phosphoesterase
MRVALISDVHSHLQALEAVLADAAAAGAERVICLGDVVDMGPQPSEVVARLRGLGCPVVVGNHDPLTEGSSVPPLQAIEAWNAARLSAADRAWLDAAPLTLRLELDGLRLLCAHGSPRDYREGLVPELADATLEQWLAGEDCDVLACGHTHVQLERTLVNAGSVSMPFEVPFDGAPPRILPWAEYALLSWEAGRLGVTLRRVPYDFAAYCDAVRASGMPEPDWWLGPWVTAP